VLPTVRSRQPQLPSGPAASWSICSSFTQTAGPIRVGRLEPKRSTQSPCRPPTLDPDDIARHQRGHVDAFGLSLAHDKRRMPQLRMQRLDRTLGAVLIEEAKPNTQAADQKNDQRVEALTDKE
jgi:hypothetical protein